jgi:hypothetical protein
MKYKWKRGHNGRFWNANEIKELKFQRQPISPDEVDQWTSLGYDYVKSFTGSMYDNRNPMPNWVTQFQNIFGHRFSNFTYTFYRMSTLEIMPTHVDHYTRYMALTGAEYKNVRRIIVMLEDWKPGHYLEIGGTGIVNWIAGDWFMWDADCPHAASNIGVEDRYTLQITCEEKEDSLAYDTDKIWKNIHWYNIPGLRSIKESISPFMNRVVNAINNMDGKPWMVYMYNENIDKLEHMFHPDETIDYLNEHGLDIFLYEPLCSYKKGAVQLFPPKGTKHSMWFYSEFTGREDPALMRADELDSISKYINNNKLTNVTVRTCDYDVATQYPFYSNMKLVADDLFLRTFIPLNVESVELQPNFNKKFICLNWRYTPHRHLMAAYMSTMDSYVSWYFRSDLFTISKGPWYNIYEWNQTNFGAYNRIVKGIEILNNKAPMNVDLQLDEAIAITDNYFMDCWPKRPDDTGMLSPSITNPQTNTLEQFYNDIFCDIVTESRFAQPTGNYSEKTYQPMFYRKPFILVAPPFTLKALREEGFKTFNEFWDESYDECEIHEERMFKIFEIINMLNDKSIDELREMYSKMTEILLHNRRLIDKKIAPL